jgi:lipoprotein-anchoring transpeptidase ErfK/SrfK
MSKQSFPIFLVSVSLLSVAASSSALARDVAPIPEPQVLYAPDAPQAAPVQMASAQRSNMGGGFIEYLFNGGQQAPAYDQPYYQQMPAPQAAPMMPQGAPDAQEDAMIVAQPGMDPKFEKQLVTYTGKEPPGTIIVDTRNKFLFLVQEGGTALRYGVGVGKEGFAWSGVNRITNKREWPDWTPPAEMLQRRPDLPRHMAGGIDNPLGARAMYIGSTLYRIHGSNEPWTIGTAVSSGCIRMRNEDVVDLYPRVKVGTRVIVM